MQHYSPHPTSNQTMAVQAQGEEYSVTQGGGYGMAAPPHIPQGGDGLWNGPIVQTYRICRPLKARAVNLHKEDLDYWSVHHLFCRTLPRARVNRIFHLQNNGLWDLFAARQNDMVWQNGTTGGLERMLFHGTRCQNVDNICEVGFDCSRCRYSTFGYGTYFTRDSVTSHEFSPAAERRCNIPRVVQLADDQCPPRPDHSPEGDTEDPAARLMTPSTSAVVTWDQHAGSSLVQGGHGAGLPPRFQLQSPFRRAELLRALCAAPDSYVDLRYMFVVRVLAGVLKRGAPGYRTPPGLYPGGPRADCCVDNESNPEVFVIFNSRQTYPQYLVEFTSS